MHGYLSNHFPGAVKIHSCIDEQCNSLKCRYVIYDEFIQHLSPLQAYVIGLKLKGWLLWTVKLTIFSTVIIPSDWGSYSYQLLVRNPSNPLDHYLLKAIRKY